MNEARGPAPAWLSAVAIALTLGLDGAALLGLRGWPAGVATHLACYVAAGLAWLLLAWCRPRARWLVAAGALLHVAALAAPPAESDDIYRYLWDGQVQRAGLDPYLHAPDDPALASLRGPLWERVNNRQLPTIYPPFAQLSFHAAARLPLSPLASWKLVAGLADAAVVATLALAAGTGAAVLWLLSPLVLIEVGVNAHVDIIGIALLCAALVAIRRRPALAGALLGLATGAKLLPAYLVVALRSWRLRLAGLAMLLLVFLPYAGAGWHVTGSLGEYGRRWRSNDGAFAVLDRGARAVVWLAGKRAPTDETRLGGLTRLVTGRDREEAYPDELAGAAARATSFSLFVLVVGLALRHAHRRGLALADTARLLCAVGVGSFLLLTPALHPWYVLWVLPVVLLGDPCARASRPWLWLAATVPLGHTPLVAYLAGQPWRDPTWTRLVEHGPTIWLCALALRRGSSRLSSAPDVV